MKVGDIVIAPEGCQDWLTPNKEYVVESFWSLNTTDEYGCCITIKSDVGVMAKCFSKNDCHLNGQDWILKPTSHENTQDNISVQK